MNNVSGGRVSFRVGLTGGIASGKSTATRYFRGLGVSISDADQISREVVAPGTAGLAEVVDAFGERVLDAAGALIRDRMRQLIFDSPEARHKLEAIIHPRVRAQMDRDAEAATGPYHLFDIPLLVESTDRSRFDRVLVIDAPPELQRRRLMARDGISREAADKILAAQVSRYDRLAAADDVIDNSGSLTDLQAAVAGMHHRYLKIASQAPKDGEAK